MSWRQQHFAPGESVSLFTSHSSSYDIFACGNNSTYSYTLRNDQHCHCLSFCILSYFQSFDSVYKTNVSATANYTKGLLEVHLVLFWIIFPFILCILTWKEKPRTIVDGKANVNRKSWRIARIQEKILKVLLRNFHEFFTKIPGLKKMHVASVESIFDQNEYDIQILR